MNNGLTIKDATERWVHEMNAIPQGMIEKLMNIGDEDIHEVTEPAVGDSVYFYADLKGSGDGEKIKANTWYTLKNGEFVECD